MERATSTELNRRGFENKKKRGMSSENAQGEKFNEKSTTQNFFF